MAVTHEVVWDYDMVEPGQAAQPITTEVTPESISRHAKVCRNDNPRYHLPLLETGSLAMPSQIFGIAPKNRGGIAENNGMSVIQAHATPFAKAEGRWFTPVRAGDSITSVTRVLEKYERRGNKFVTVRLEPTNQRGEKIAEIDHTSIFEFARRARKDGDAPRPIGEEFEPSGLQETQWSNPIDTVSFDEISVGDEAPRFTIHSPAKDEESIDSGPGRFPWGGEHGVGGITIMGYVDQMLERWVPTGSLYNDGRLLFKAIKNFRPGDTVTYRAVVVDKRTKDEKRLVDFDVKGVNQLAQLTGVAEATLAVSG